MDGIPFILTGGCGFDGGRGPEFAETYLNYCITHCDWSTYKFHEVTEKQKTDALAALLSSDKVGRTLNEIQKKRFVDQIK